MHNKLVRVLVRDETVNCSFEVIKIGAYGFVSGTIAFAIKSRALGGLSSKDILLTLRYPSPDNSLIWGGFAGLDLGSAIGSFDSSLASREP